MNIAVVGTGYVGLVTGTCLAETGNHVICVDIDEKKVAAMQRGEVPIYEPNLDTLFDRNIAAGRLSFTTERRGRRSRRTAWRCNYPVRCSADLSGVKAQMIWEHQTSYKVIVDKSTVPVGTADQVREAVSKYASVAFDVVSNPEFLLEGFAVDDFK